MAIDKPLSPILNSGLENNASTVIDVKVDTIEANPEIEVSMTDEGGVIVDFDPSANTDEVDFNANLSDFISEDDLEELSNELISAYQGDKESRKDWEDTYIKGLD